MRTLTKDEAYLYAGLYCDNNRRGTIAYSLFRADSANLAPATIRHNSSAVTRQPLVLEAINEYALKARVAQDQLIEQHQMTRFTFIEELLDVYELAKEKGSFLAAVKIMREIGKACGFYGEDNAIPTVHTITARPQACRHCGKM